MPAQGKSHRPAGPFRTRFLTARIGIGAVALAAVFVLLGAAALAGCGQKAVDVGTANEVARLEAENAKLKKDLDAANAKVAALEQRVADLEESGGATATGGGTAGPDPGGTGGESGRQIGFLRRVFTKSGRYYLTIDYVQFLTGQAAVKAAVEDGEIKAGETLDNDYYVRNQNPKLRTFTIKAGIPVTVETYVPTGKASVSLAEFKAAMSPSDANNSSMRAAPWWITLKDSTVTKIAEQYIP